MKLTDVQIRKLRPGSRPYKVSDGAGLFLFVTPAGGRLWRLGYRHQGRQKELSFGAYPSITLRRARELRDAAKDDLARGVDPAEARRREKQRERAAIGATFEAVGRDWFNSQSSKWVPTYSNRIWSRLEDDVFPVIGTRPIAELLPLELLDVVRPIEARGAVEMAKRVLGFCGQICRYAVARGLIPRDPTQDLRGALRAREPVKRRSALKAPELPAFLDALSRYDGQRSTVLALRLIVLTFVRTGELRFANWSEIEDLDGPRPLWRVPAERMKMRSEHLVPLAPQAVAIFKELPRSSDMIFAARTGSGVISENTLIYALYRIGYKSRATVHGFRSTASTILNEAGFNRDWIERQLAHSDRDEVRAAYNAAEYLENRRQMMEWWARYIERAEGRARIFADLIG